MKIILTIALATIINSTSNAQMPGSLKIPKTWDKDLKFSVKHSGSMSGGESKVVIDYNTCTYTSTGLQSGDDERKVYQMTEEDRESLLKQLRALKIEKIKPKSYAAGVHDGWSHSICVNSSCLEGGTSVVFSEKNREKFQAASVVLENFAITKTK